MHHEKPKQLRGKKKILHKKKIEEKKNIIKHRKYM